MARWAQLLVAVLVVGGTGCATKARQAQAQARVELGSAYLLEGSTEMAIATLQEATRLDRRNIDGWNQLGLAMMKRGELEKSEEAFLRGLRLDDEDAAINLNYAYLLLKLERNSDAVERLEAAMKDLTYREPAKVLNNLGFAYYAEGRFGSAEQRLREAVIRAPHYCQAWYNLGLVYEALERNADAVDAYDHVIMICADDAAGSYYRAARLMLLDGKLEEATHYLNRACQGWPGSPICDQAREVLVGMESP